MLRSTKELTDYHLMAEDGEIGRCKDFLFDDEDWTVRYMVADTGTWLPDRKVIISPFSLGNPDWSAQSFPVRLTKEQVENAPSIQEHEPVSRQHEEVLSSHFSYPYYWMGESVWGPFGTPDQFREKVETAWLERESESNGDPNLRSIEEVTGYHISATDGEIGHVEEFILDDQTWTIRYMVVDTRNWLPGRKVLISPLWVADLDWAKGLVSVDMPKELIKKSPEYDPAAPVNQGYEARLFDFYGRPIY